MNGVPTKKIALDRTEFLELEVLGLKFQMAKAAYESAQAAVLARAESHGVARGQPFFLDESTLSIVVG